MKKLSSILSLLFCCLVMTFAQNAGGGAGSAGGGAAGGSAGAGNGGGVSDGAVVRSAASQKRSGKSEAQIASSLLQQGATPQQLQRLRSQYSNQINKAGLSSAVDNGLREAIDRSRSNSESASNPTMQLAGADDMLVD